MKRLPRFVRIILAVIVVGALVVALTAWQVVEIAEREEQRDCARAVASRTDARAMWLYLIDTADPDANSERVDRFATKLDELLPALKCEGGNWVPDRGERAG